MTRNIETFLGCDKEWNEANIVLFGAPFDSTSSYRPGSRFMSRTMRAESYGLETYSPYQDLDLETDSSVFDSGDLELCFGDTEKALAGVYEVSKKILAANKTPFLLGGEHLVSLPAVKATYEKYPALRLIHFDAHTDLRDDYLGAKLSHATVIRRVHDFLGDGHIFQFGIRSGERAEFMWAKTHTQLQKFDFSGLTAVTKSLQDYPVYLTVDLDVLDPSILCGTGTPEAGGVNFVDLLNACLTVIKDCNVVACDMTELAPNLDTSGTSTAVALKLLREMLLAIGVKRI